MSRHRSLKIGAGLVRQRSVLSRKERLDALNSDGKWQAGQSIFGLPKVRVRIVKARKAAAKKPGADQAATEQVPEAEAAE